MNGSQETPKHSRMGPFKEPYGNQTISRVYWILLVLCSKLLKDSTTPSGPHKETNDVAMGTKRGPSISNP